VSLLRQTARPEFDTASHEEPAGSVDIVTGPVRILVARCEIAYHGRAATRLGEGDRVILFKDDGSLCVHAERGYKPLNYMPGPTTVREEGDTIRVYRPASDETLVILLHDVLHDATHELVDGATLEREGAEREIHALLERAPEAIEPGLVVLERERFTDVGPVDLFCRDADGRTVVVEVKRVRALAAHVEQLCRYCERVDLDPAHRPCRGILVAPEIAPQARVMCEARGMTFVRFDYESLRDQAPPELTLFE
jgi:endonuclease